MSHRKLSLCMLLMVCLPCVGLAAHPNLVGAWSFDEGSGDVVADGSGNGNDGTLINTTWVEGQLGSALGFDGSAYVDIPPQVWADVSAQFTFTFWVYIPNADIQQSNFIVAAFSDPANNNARVFSAHLPWGGATVYYDTSGPGYDRTSQAITPADLTDAWNHWAFTKNADTGNAVIYRNGEVWHTATGLNKPLQGPDITKFTIGTKASLAEGWFTGMIDDVQLYNAELSQEEIQATMLGIGNKALAGNPEPQDAGEDVLRDSVLSWSPGAFAGTHNLYLGESFEDVNNATVATAAGLTDTSYDAGRFEFGKTYFWRVDEVNATPDKTVFAGDVWSFTAEPYSIQIPGDTIAVTASSSSNEFSLPEKTIDGSGLGADGTHEMGPESMWFTAAVDLDPWIQYDLGGVKKLDIMKVWNSNSSAEIAIGWGVKDVKVEYSVDGENWEALDAAQLSRAPGSPAYKEYDSIDFGGVAAKHVRLDIESNWGGILMSYGISEAQFYMIPAEARTPAPASGAVDVLPSAVVQWRAGREAAQHTIYVGTDADAVADGSAPSVTSNTNSLDLASLDLALGETYYWRVDEVNEAEAANVWPGPVWSLSTAAALIVDDFESYGNVSPDRPFQAWLDGFGYSADEFFPSAYGGNGTGSGTGHDIWSLASPQYDGDIMEGSITVAGSGQSMPIYYNNASGSSHVDRTFTPAQDWTANGVQTLGLSFYGDVDNGGQLYITINGTKVTYDLDADALKQAEWHFWAIDLASVGVNLQAVTSMGIGVDGSGSGMLYVDDIALYSNAIEYITPIEPGTENLVAQYTFEGNYGDSSGNGNTLTEVGGVAIVNDSERGNVAVFNGLDAALAVPVIGDGTTAALTIATWFRLDIEHNGSLWSVFHNDGWSAGDLHAHIGGTANIQMGVNGLGANIVDGSVTVGQWYHIAYVAGPDGIALYVNGVLAGQAPGDPALVFSLGEGTLGAWDNNGMQRFIGGSVDDVRIYTEALTAAEIAGLAGRQQMYKPF